MNTYYEITANIDGETEILFGSFDKSDCAYELDAEKESWKCEGFKSIKIVSRKTEEKPDAEVYGDSVACGVTYTEACEGFVVATITNDAGQELDIVEHPEDGDESTLLVVDHSSKSVFDSEDWDSEDMLQGGDYTPYVVDGELMREFQLDSVTIEAL